MEKRSAFSDAPEASAPSCGAEKASEAAAAPAALDGAERPAGLALDHLVLTAANPEAAIRFYSALFGGVPERAGGRLAVSFGTFKINIHQAGAERRPCAKRPAPGSADLCFVSETPLAERLARLEALGVPLELGPVVRPGACGPIESVYCRDPDGNLVEWGAPVRRGAPAHPGEERADRKSAERKTKEI